MSKRPNATLPKISNMPNVKIANWPKPPKSSMPKVSLNYA